MKTKPKVVKRKIKRKQEYRTLKKGERIRKGDEIGNGAGDWWPCGDTGHKSTGIALLRRPIKMRKRLSKKQVKKNREEADFCATAEDLPKGWGGIITDEEVEAMNKALDPPASSFRIDYYGNAIVHGDDGVTRLATIPKGTFMTMDLATALFAKYQEVGRMLSKEEVKQVIESKDEPALDITVDTGKPRESARELLQEVRAYNKGEGKYNYSSLSGIDRSMASLEGWEQLEYRIDNCLRVGDCEFYPNPTKGEIEQALQSDFESSKKRLIGEAESRDIYKSPWRDVFEPEDKHSGTIIVAMIVLFCAFAGGFATGHYAHKPRVEYKNQILYRNAAQTYDLKANPFESNKIKLQPWQIEIIEGR